MFQGKFFKHQFKDNTKERGLDLFFIVILFLLVVSGTYGPRDLLQFYDQDFYQLLADAFRNLRISISRDVTCIMDLTEFGDGFHISWGPLPAFFYAVLDAISIGISGAYFPKVLPYVLALFVHILFMFKLLKRVSRFDVIPYLVITMYCFSFPFYFFAHGEMETEQISTLYATTFFIVSTYYYYRGKSPSLLSALFLGMANLTRISYWFYSVFFVANSLLSKATKKTKICYALIVSSSFGIFFAYNFLRFGNIFNFGERTNKYHGKVIEVFNDMGLTPKFPAQFLNQAQELFSDLYHIDPSISLFKHDYVSVFFERISYMMYGPVHSHFFGWLFFGAIVYWVRKPKKNYRELVFASSVIVLGLFWTYHIQCIFLRYLMHFWPMMIVLITICLNDLYKIAGSRTRISLVAVFSIYICWATYLLPFERNRDIDHLKKLTMIYPTQYTGKHCQKLNPYQKITCDDVDTMNRVGQIHDYDMEKDYYKLGIYRDKINQCRSLFFSGGTFIRKSNAKCRFYYEHAGDVDCNKIRLYQDGNYHKNLESISESVCSSHLERGSRSTSQLYLYFTPIKAKNVPAKSIYTDLINYSFKSFRVECN